MAENRRRKKKPKFKPIFYFLCIVVVYTLLLLVLSGMFLAYADICIRKFERSQSSYAIEDYMEGFKKSLAKKKMPEGFDAEDGSIGSFEDSDIRLEALIAATDGKTVSYEKDKNSYNTEEPVYDILADDTTIAKITLTAYNERTVFGILTIMDWKISKTEILSLPELDDYTIWAPEGSTVTVNGKTVSDDYLTGNVKDEDLFTYVKEYVNIPSIREYLIPALGNPPEVAVTGPSGENCEVIADGTNYETVYFKESDIPDDIKETALNISETWSLFMTDDLTGGKHGLDTIKQYLIPGSDYDVQAEEWAGGVDITFTSPHTLENPAFTNVKVSEYVRYSDDCFSCRISFDKPMFIKSMKKTVVDTTDSIYIFVKYNDTWCLAGMR